MKQLWADACNNITLDGLREIYSTAGGKRQKFWIIVFLFCNLATFYYIYQVIAECVTKGVISQITYEESDVYEMPKLSFCSSRWFNVSAMTAAGLSMEAIKFSLMLYNKPNISVENISAARNELIQFLAHNNYSSLIDFFAATSVYRSQNSFTLFNWREDTTIYLNSSNSFIDKNVDNNLCLHTTALGTVKREEVKAYGEYAGVELTVHLHDETQHMAEEDLIYLSFMNPKYEHMMNSDPIMYLSLHHRYHLTIVPRYFNLRSGNCIRTDQNPTYRKDTCTYACRAEYVTQHRARENIPLYHLTSSDERNAGLQKIPSYIYPEHPDYAYNVKHYYRAASHCEAQCRTECETAKYEIALTSSKLHEDRGRMLSIMFRLEVENGILSVRDMDGYSIDTLVANFGGVFGLFLGGNVFTLIQIAVYIWDWCMVKAESKTKTSNSKSSKSDTEQRSVTESTVHTISSFNANADLN